MPLCDLYVRSALSVRSYRLALFPRIIEGQQFEVPGQAPGPGIAAQLHDGAGRDIAQVLSAQSGGKFADARIVADERQRCDVVRTCADDFQHGVRAGKVEPAHPLDILDGERDASRDGLRGASGASCGAAEHAFDFQAAFREGVSHHRCIAFPANVQRPVKIG